jgi:hypothetical protein
MIEMPPTPGGDVVIERGPATTFRATEAGVASMDEPDIEPVLLGVQSEAFDSPGPVQGQKS